VRRPAKGGMRFGRTRKNPSTYPGRLHWRLLLLAVGNQPCNDRCSIQEIDHRQMTDTPLHPSLNDGSENDKSSSRTTQVIGQLTYGFLVTLLVVLLSASLSLLCLVKLGCLGDLWWFKDSLARLLSVIPLRLNITVQKELGFDGICWTKHFFSNPAK
jgi:hypothetical protein